MALIASYQTISHAESAAETQYFNVILDGDDTVISIMVGKVSTEVSHFLYGHTRKLFQHFRSNVWMSLLPILPFLRLKVISQICNVYELLAMKTDDYCPI